MTLRLLKGLGIGVFILLLLYFGGLEILYPYVVSSKRSAALETQYIDELQEYVTEHGLEATDYTTLKEWAENQKIDRMTIARGNWLIFDSSYAGEISLGAQTVSPQALQAYFTVNFSDGDAQVFIDEGYGQIYYNILLGVSIAAGLAACLGIFASGMHEDIVRIRKLEKEVSQISGGNLKNELTISGEDELSDLAKGIDHMRLSLQEKERKETEMRQAQEKLVLGMSHDLRTPLTGLMTYMEVLKQQQKDGKMKEEFLDKAMDRVQQIRGLSDEMFEYFLVTSHENPELEGPDEVDSVFGDYLSEMCSLLECDGFSVNSIGIEWRPAYVLVNMDYIGRIFNNIISNVENMRKRRKPCICHWTTKRHLWVYAWKIKLPVMRNRPTVQESVHKILLL